MQAKIIKIGNSKGIRIPKALLEQCNINGTVDIAVKGKSIVIKAERKPREGWAEAFELMAKRGDDDTEELREWRAFPNDFDKKEWIWE